MSGTLTTKFDTVRNMANKPPGSPEPPGNEQEAHRVRLIIDSEEIVNAAAQLRASKRSVAEHRRVSKSEVVNAILREALREEIAEIERYSATGRKSRK